MAGFGPVEMRVRLDIGMLGELKGLQGSLAEAAYALAREIDSGAGRDTAPIARELRLTLAEIAKGAPSDSDDGILGGLSVPERVDMPASVRDTKDMESPDFGPEGQ